MLADILVACVFVISVLAGLRKGFTLLVFNLIAWLVTIILVLTLCKPVTNMVYEKTEIDEFFAEHIESTIGDFIEEQLENSEHINTGKTNIARPIADKINGYIDETKENSVNHISSYIAEKLAYVVVSALVVIVLCIVIRIAAIFLKAILWFITELPFIHAIDKVGGIAYGILRAYIIVYLILGVLSLLSPLIANTGIIACINNSKVCSYFYNNNVFLKILMK